MKLTSLLQIFSQYRLAGSTLRRRLFLYFISSVALILALILLLLNLFGILNPTNAQLMNTMESNLSVFCSQVTHDTDKVAAYAISFASHLEDNIQNYLTEQNLSFDELRDNTGAITALQSQLYDTVYLHMQLAPSSGVFYLLDTTVNSRSEVPLYNGIYLKYINLVSESTVNNEFTLYRGSYATGKEHGITFHSGWQNEMQTDFFNVFADTFTDGVHYALSPAVKIPDTWERARYVYVPIHDMQENVIGVCGFEINDLYFQLMNKAENDGADPIVYALLDDRSGTYSGQFSINQYGIADNAESGIRIYEKKGLSYFDFGTDTCVGKTCEVMIGGEGYLAAIMLPKDVFDNRIRHGQFHATVIILIVILTAFICCVVISRKYVSPILKKLEQVRSRGGDVSHLSIPEIDDLIDYLEARDIGYEQRLRDLESAKHAAEEEAARAKEAYEKALSDYEIAQREIQSLADDRRHDIVLEDFEFFICNLGSLTPKEYSIYELYIEGKTAKEIMEILDIKENTMKFHNKNIYSKLGISSRKQLLKFAALKKQQETKGETTL